MSKFTGWLEDNLLAESLIESVDKIELDELNEALSSEIERIDEFLGLGKFAKKVGAFSEKDFKRHLKRKRKNLKNIALEKLQG